MFPSNLSTACNTTKKPFSACLEFMQTIKKLQFAFITNKREFVGCILKFGHDKISRDKKCFHKTADNIFLLKHFSLSLK